MPFGHLWLNRWMYSMRRRFQWPHHRRAELRLMRPRTFFLRAGRLFLPSVRFRHIRVGREGERMPLLASSCPAGTVSSTAGASRLCPPSPLASLTWLFKDTANGFYYLNMQRVRHLGQTSFGYTKARIQSKFTLDMSALQLYVRFADSSASPCS
jgi:hypothetical protein